MTSEDDEKHIFFIWPKNIIISYFKIVYGCQRTVVRPLSKFWKMFRNVPKYHAFWTNLQVGYFKIHILLESEYESDITAFNDVIGRQNMQKMHCINKIIYQIKILPSSRRLYIFLIRFHDT